jgi:hypothetical protein
MVLHRDKIHIESELCSASAARTMFVVDAHRGDGKRFIVQAEEKLTAFLELERTLRERTL